MWTELNNLLVVSLPKLFADAVINSLYIITALIIVLIATWAAYLVGLGKNGTSIPGPSWSLPILGHIHLLGHKPHLTLTAMSKKYGDVFKLRLGIHSAVVICGKETIKAACAMGSLSGRPHQLFNSWRKHERYFAFGHSQKALQYRKLTLITLAGFIKNDNHLRDVIQQEATLLSQMLCSSDDSSSHQEAVCTTVSSIMYFLCFGEKATAANNSEFKEVMDSISDIMNFARQASFADTFYWATWIPSIQAKYKLFLNAQDNLVRLVKGQEERHSLECNNKANDIMYEFKKVFKDDDITKEKSTDELDRIGTLMEQTGMLLVAGCETVATTLNWTILLLAAHPLVQERLYAELVLKTEEKANKNLYMEAFILEVLRFSMASPLAMPHFTLSDTMIKGYHIPRNTLILINLWSGSRVQSIWGDNSEKFYPERFLLNDNTEINMLLADCVQAFGSGRRRCVGEQLARVELDALLTALIMSCEIKLKNENEPVNFWSIDAVRNKPPNVPLIFKERM